VGEGCAAERQTTVSAGSGRTDGARAQAGGRKVGTRDRHVASTRPVCDAVGSIGLRRLFSSIPEIEITHFNPHQIIEEMI